MTAQLAPAPVFRSWDNLGFPLVGGKLYTYAAGTTHPQATYTDSTQTTPNTNPVILNFRGEAQIWLDPTLSYKFILKDAFNNLIWTVDNIQGALFIIYPRTAGEIAAGVVPTNFTYPPGNVLRYGADNTGIVDCSAAVGNAIASLPSGGGDIYFPAGVYKLTSATMNKSGTIYGDGYGVSQIYAGDATSDVWTLTTSTIEMRDLAILSSGTRSAGRYINCTNASSIITLENLYLLNWFYGIELSGTDYSLQNIEMRNGVASSGQAIRIGLSASPGTLSDISLINVRVDNAAGAKPDAAIAIAQCGDVSMIDCQWQHCNFGMSVVPGASQVATSILAVNCFFDNAGTTGCRIIPSANTGAAIRIRFNGCWFSSAGGEGLQIDTSISGGTVDGVHIIDPQVLLNGSHGIAINGSGTSRVRVLGGAIAGNTGCGIAVFANTSQFSVQNATIGPWGSIGGNTTFGIQVGAGTSNDYEITGNDLRGNTSASLSDGGTGTTKTVHSNLGYNPTSNTLIANTSTSPVTWANNTGSPAYVSVTGTPTITTITMGGLQIGATTGTAYLVPQGQTITVNFSAGTANVTYWGAI